jgi:hypothetical protein
LQKHPNNCFSFLTLGNYVIPPLKICFFNWQQQTSVEGCLISMGV